LVAFYLPFLALDGVHKAGANLQPNPPALLTARVVFLPRTFLLIYTTASGGYRQFYRLALLP